MKHEHDLIKELFEKWQIYINEYLNDFVYFNEFLKNKGYQYDVLAVGKNNLIIYKINIDNLSYLITDYGVNVEIQYHDNKLDIYINLPLSYLG